MALIETSFEELAESLHIQLKTNGGKIQKYVAGRRLPFGISVFTDEEIDSMLDMVVTLRAKYRYLRDTGKEL